MLSSPSAQTDRRGFLDRAASSGLLTPNQRAKADASLPQAVTTAALAAQQLVASGVLTRFQAERLLAGRTDGFVLGQYAIEDPIGRGPSGRVYRAKHRTMNRLVAVKVLAPELTRTDAARQEFRDGVRLAARLTHANVVTTYDANEVGNRFYVVMEYVDGPSLQGLVEREGPLSAGEACGLIRQVATGLQHAHEQGMAHHNLTPGNVLVGKPARGTVGHAVKVTDFRLSRRATAPPAAFADRTPVSPAALARLAYAAPERLADPEGDDRRSDLYGLGAVFHFALTGRAPSPVGPVEWPAAVPPPVVALVAALLARDPAERIQTAAEVVARLDELSASYATVDNLTAVSFDLPHAAGRTGGTSGGYLTGIPEPELSPWADIVAHSGAPSAEDTLAPDEPGATPVALPAMADLQPTAAYLRPRQPAAAGVSPLVLVVLAGSMVLVCLLAIFTVTRLASG